MGITCGLAGSGLPLGVTGGLEEGPRLTPGSDGPSFPAQHEPAWSLDPGGVCVCVCVCVKGGTQAHPFRILSLLEPGNLRPGGGGWLRRGTQARGSSEEESRCPEWSEPLGGFKRNLEVLGGQRAGLLEAFCSYL